MGSRRSFVHVATGVAFVPAAHSGYLAEGLCTQRLRRGPGAYWMESGYLTHRQPDAEMSLSHAIQFLEGLSDAEDERQLTELDGAVETIARSDDDLRTAVPALLSVFERFPTSDGFGVFWGILHAPESVRGSYEHELIASLRRIPSELGVMMVNRCLNAGERRVGATDLLQLLVDVSRMPDAKAQVRDLASEYVRRHEAGQLGLAADKTRRCSLEASWNASTACVPNHTHSPGPGGGCHVRAGPCS